MTNDEDRDIYKDNGKSNSSEESNKGCKWTESSINELKIWLALVIYIGIFKFSSVEDY
ncbi:hypothetical protein RhiirA1_475434 [Rhizophagus irregularis]|uniref:Uncharacterized protein n=1 Tax=Rhizophagus irregularis TaxID=588596 RepID=A0A2N0QX16_9GLOM|nr:hypothetical protein RhiirA1_475434 [Rhizophagus irregularis]